MTRTVTVTGNTKVFANGKTYRPGQTFELTEHKYLELLEGGICITDVDEIKKEKPKSKEIENVK